MTWPESVSIAVQHIDETSVMRFYRSVFAFRRNRMGPMDLKDWSRDGEVIHLTYPEATVLLNFGPETVEMSKAPDFASGPCDDGIPGRTAAIWMTDD